MKLSYAITACNESKELYALISFLKSVKDPEDEINVLLDTLHTTETLSLDISRMILYLTSVISVGTFQIIVIFI